MQPRTIFRAIYGVKASTKALVDEILQREADLQAAGAEKAGELARFYIEASRLARILPIENALRYQVAKRNDAT